MQNQATIKPAFSVYGNCQAAAIARVLQEAPSFRSKYRIAPLPPCFAATEEQIKNWTNEASPNVELLITQKLRTGWRGKPLFDVDYLHEVIGRRSPHITWSDIYYKGYEPQMAYPFTFPRPSIGDYVNIAAELAFVHGKTVDDLIALYTNRDAFHRQAVEGIHQIALSSLASREAGCEMRASDFIASHWRERRLFFTFNHPCRAVVAHMARQALRHLGLRDDLPENGPELFGGIFPSPSLASFDQVLEVSQDDNFMERFRLEGKYVSAREYFERWFAFFNSLGKEKVAADLQKHLQANPISNLFLSLASKPLSINL